MPDRWGGKKEALRDLYQRVQGCRCDCPGTRAGAGVSWDRDGNPGAGVVILGEAPGREELKQGRPFAGQAGQKLDIYLGLAGLTRADIFIINTVKCRPTRNDGRANRTPGRCEIKSCAHWLEEELQILAPRVILTLGDVALKNFDRTLTIGGCHGQPMSLGPYRVFPLYHPAAAIYRHALEEVIRADFVRLGQWLRHG